MLREGEVRYSSGTNPSEYTYTGQYSYTDDFGLMYYGARWYDPSLGRFSQPDMIIPQTQGIQAWDRYAYSNNNPVKYTDPSGHFIETAFDLAMIGVDLVDIAQNGLNWSNGAALAVDVASAVIPGIPAVGGVLLKVSKAANAVDNVVDTVNAVDNVVDTANAVDNAVDAGNAADNAADLENMIGATCSFSADTQVTTREGSESISAIEIGDYVLAWNEADGTLGYYEVTNAFHHTDEVVTEVIIGGEWIETTPEHPFYVEGEGWAYAEDLQIGDEVRQADGTTGVVWLKWNVTKTQEMYNLTVDTAHTFFVGEGQWLVHNACRPIKMDAIDWRGYPDDIVPRPQGQLYFLDGADYDEARRLADNFNKKIRRQNPDFYQGFAIHEIQPVKFGGSPTDLANKMKVDKYLHEQFVTPWWNRLQRQIENNPKNYLLLE